MSLFGLVHQFWRNRLELRGLEGDNSQRLVTLFGGHLIELGNVANQFPPAPPHDQGQRQNHPLNGNPLVAQHGSSSDPGPDAPTTHGQQEEQRHPLGVDNEPPAQHGSANQFMTTPSNAPSDRHGDDDAGNSIPGPSASSAHDQGQKSHPPNGDPLA